jgi:hypothetical protein
VHPVGGGVHPVDGGAAQRHAGPELLAPGADQVGHVGVAERDEQQPRLVEMAVVGVHHDDLRLVRLVLPAQPVGGQCAAGAAAQDDDAFHKVIFCG